MSVSVNQSGVVTGKGSVGQSATITATPTKKNVEKKTCKVTIVKESKIVSPVPNLDKSKIEHGLNCSCGGHAGQTLNGVYYKHAGIDLHSRMTGGSYDVYAAATGIIIDLGYSSGGKGHWIWIQSADGKIIFEYEHLASNPDNSSEPLKKYSKGQSVTAGEKIGEMGSSGNVEPKTARILHFGMIINGEYVNPLDYI